MLTVLATGCGSAPPAPPKVEPPPKVELPPKADLPKIELPPKGDEKKPPLKLPEKPPDLPDLPDPTKGATKGNDAPKLPGPSRWKIAATLDQKQRCTGLAFSTTGDLLAACGGGDAGDERDRKPPVIRLYKTADWTSDGELTGHTEGVVAVLFSPDSKVLVSAGGKLTRDAELKVWDMASRKPVSQVRSPGGVIGTMAFDPAGNILFTGGESRLIKLWDFSTGKLPANAKPFEQFDGHSLYVTSLSLSPNGKFLASASADLSLRLWTVAESKLRTMLRGHYGQVNCCTFNSNGDYLASVASNGDIKLWDIQAVTELAAVKVDPPRMLVSVAFSPDTQWVAAGAADGSITIMDFPTRKFVETLREFPDYVNQLAFSPDGKHLAAAGEDGRVVVWNVPKP